METIRDPLEADRKKKFKSYYVVWKLSMISFSSTEFLVFKSYYVVWKLKAVFFSHHHISCLNRTMQYGNFPAFRKIKIHRFRLNRTMQYGNSYLVSPAQGKSECLNRTMQYGNFIAYTIFDAPVFLFKSYYVVWKREVFRSPNIGGQV